MFMIIADKRRAQGLKSAAFKKCLWPVVVCYNGRIKSAAVKTTDVVHNCPSLACAVSVLIARLPINTVYSVQSASTAVLL